MNIIKLEVRMKRCPSCKAIVSDEFNFCAKCGSELIEEECQCAKCGRTFAGGRFCPYCRHDNSNQSELLNERKLKVSFTKKEVAEMEMSESQARRVFD